VVLISHIAQLLFFKRSVHFFGLVGVYGSFDVLWMIIGQAS